MMAAPGLRDAVVIFVVALNGQNNWQSQHLAPLQAFPHGSMRGIIDEVRYNQNIPANDLKTYKFAPSAK